MADITVKRDRNNVVALSLPYDVSSETFVSEIREEESTDSAVIESWDITMVGDGTDGELLMTLPHARAGAVTQRYGYMDVKRMIDGEPYAAFDEFLTVEFEGVVTA